MAQEAKQAFAAGDKERGGGGAATAARRQEHASAATHLIDPGLIDEYLDVPCLKTIHDILLKNDPRRDMYGIREGIEHGGYRTALEKLLPSPPPRDHLGGRRADNRARMLERLGRYEEAEPLYRDLAGEAPWRSATHLAMARVLEHLGRRKESAESLARACRLDSDCRLAFEAGMRPDPRQLDPAAVPLRLIVPMSVISAAGAMRSRAELSAASLLVQAECGLDLYPRSGARLPGCAGLGADMERFHHLVVEDALPHCIDTGEQPYYYDLTDRGIGMIGPLGERLDRGGDGATASARVAESARRVAALGPHAVLEEACAASPAPAGAPAGPDGAGFRGAVLSGLAATAGRIRRELGNGVAFGGAHAIPIAAKAEIVPDMLSQARGAPAGQWAVAAALACDLLGLCARIVFDQRPHPRTAALGPPYQAIQDMYALLVRYCRARGVAEPKKTVRVLGGTSAEDIEELSRDMIRAVSGS